MVKIELGEFFELLEEIDSGFILKDDSGNVVHIPSDIFFDIIPIEQICEVRYIDEIQQNINILLNNGCTLQLEVL